MHDIGSSLDLKTAIERMGDREIFLEIAHYFAGTLPGNIQEMEEMLQREDMNSLMRLAHSCKSNCASMGAEEERVLCLELEQAARSADKEKSQAILAQLKPKLLILKDTLSALS